MELTDTERAILGAIRDGAKHAIEIWEQARLSAATATGAISSLREVGLIREVPHKDWPTYELTRGGWDHLDHNHDDGGRAATRPTVNEED